MNMPSQTSLVNHHEDASDSQYQLAKLQKQVSDLNQKLQQAESLANIGLWEWHIENDEVSWSENTYKMFEMPQGSPICYQKVIDKVHPEDRDNHNQRTKEWLEKGGGAPYEYRIITEQNQVRYFKAYGKVELDEQQQPKRFIGAIQDITEQVLLQKRLEQSLTKVISDFIPICAWCSSIKEETSNKWLSIEDYLHSKNEDVGLSHGICPTCKQTVERELQEKVAKMKR